MRTSVGSFKETKITKMVVVAFFLGLLIGYLWGRVVEKPPHAVWLGDDNFINVSQRAGGYVYRFGPMGGGGYEFITATSPKSDDYPFWANPEKSTRIIRKKIK
jgi:hypothetical protein